MLCSKPLICLHLGPNQIFLASTAPIRPTLLPLRAKKKPPMPWKKPLMSFQVPSIKDVDSSFLIFWHPPPPYRQFFFFWKTSMKFDPSPPSKLSMPYMDGPWLFRISCGFAIALPANIDADLVYFGGYGNLGCQVFKGGIQNKIYFWPKINIPTY